MSFRFKKLSGFSLAETLIALGILAVGMLLIAGVFPVAIQLITVSAERTTAAVIAEEAFAKVQLYAAGDPATNTDDVIISRLSGTGLTDFNNPVINAFPAIRDVGQYEFTYPSTGPTDNPNSQYCWSALCRLTGVAANNPPVQVTVFVCRKAGRAATYYEPGSNGIINWPTPNRTDWPRPAKINVLSVVGSNNQLRIQDAINEKNLINDDYTIVDDQSGQIYRVVKRLPAPNDDIIQLDRVWSGVGTDIWVVPPAIGGGRNPCIAVYQKEILF